MLICESKTVKIKDEMQTQPLRLPAVLQLLSVTSPLEWYTKDQSSPNSFFHLIVTDSLESGDREQDQKRERSFRHKTVTEELSELSMT